MFDPIVIQERGVALFSSDLAAPAPVMMEMVAEEDASRPSVPLAFQGLTAIYHLPGSITLEGDGAEVLFTIDSAGFDAELTARATPLLDENA